MITLDRFKAANAWQEIFERIRVTGEIVIFHVGNHQKNLTSRRAFIDMNWRAASGAAGINKLVVLTVTGVNLILRKIEIGDHRMNRIHNLPIARSIRLMATGRDQELHEAAAA